MADFESNIRIDIDTANALAAIRSLQKEISAFHSSLAKGSATASTASANLQKDLINNINATGAFSASMTRVKTTTESFTNALEKNKLSMGEYFRYAGGASKNFSRFFTQEFDTLNKVARERVKDLQTQYIQLGRDASGAMQAIKVRPLVLDLNDLNTKTQIAAQRQQLFNQLLKQGSTNLLNFGKNTQWAGRQLMVGFTIPLSIMASTAAKEFMKIEKQAIRFKRVYGDAFSTSAETEEALKNVKELASEFTKYGVELEKTMELAADAAQMGLKSADLMAQVSEATRLAVLGEIEQQEALATSISLTNAFGIAAEDLAKKINFLNAVENETVTAISDLTIAIPKAAPVIRQLGGDVEDLAFFLTAMKEGGINASEGANALKSGLASLINPTGKASEMLQGLGIDITGIVEANKGDVKGLVIEFAEALDTLDPLNRARAIEQLFGKFQFSRLSTLFQNVTKDGTQASRVLDLAGASASELATIADRELGNIAESSMFKFQKAVEDLKIAIAPIGEQFLKAITPIIEFGTKLLEQFNNLGDGVKNFVVIGGAVIAGLGPIFLMTFGLIANGVANIIKGFAAVRGLFLKTKDSSSVLGEQLEYMSQEQIEAASIASSLERVHAQLEQRFTSEAAAVSALTAAYQRGITAQQAYSGLPRVQRPGSSGPVVKANKGLSSVPGPKGAGDIVPALLSPGEAVIPADAAKMYAPIIQGMIAGNLPGFAKGVMLGMPRSGKSTGKNRDAAQQIYEKFLQSSYRDVQPTNYGHQLSPTSGHSFPIFGLGGVYMGPGGKKVFVKPVMDENAALAEMRGTQIARQAHGLEAPEQRIVVIRDPQDVSGTRRFLALESDLDSKFVNTEPKALFNEEQYFRQLVASLVRVDKDLAAGNLFGNVVADVGPAGVFDRASGPRDYKTNLPSMEDQAMINLLGIKGGAKRAFAESTVGLMSKMTADQYHQYMIAEIQRVLPSLRQTVAGFGLTNPAEADAYAAMIKRLEAGLGVDWRKFHSIHSAVKVTTPKQSINTPPIPGYADGVVSVPGPKGKGDIVPAMLSPGEAVIPADKAKRYRGLISDMVAGTIPGYQNSVPGGIPVPDGTQSVNAQPRKIIASHFDLTSAKRLGETLSSASKYLSDGFVEIFDVIKKTSAEGYTVVKEMSSLSDMASKAVADGSVVFAGGAAYSGTAVPGDSRRNEMFNRIGIEGEPFRLDSLISAADLAEKELLSGSEASSKWSAELRQLADQGSTARRSLQESNDETSLHVDYMRQNAKRSIEHSLLVDKRIRIDGKKITADQASLIAEERLLKVDQELEAAKKNGLKKEALIQDAQDRYIAVMQEFGTGQFARGSAEGAGPKAVRDASRNMIRTSGPQAVDRPEDFSMPYRGAMSSEAVELQAKQISQSLNISVDQAIDRIFDNLYARIDVGLDRNSPSKEFAEISKDISDGVRSGSDDATAAGAEVGKRITQSVLAQSPKVYKLPGLQRVTTDINVYQAAMQQLADRQKVVFDKLIMQHRIFQNSLMAESLRVVPTGEAYDTSTRQRVPGGDKIDFQSVNNTLMNLSFAFSSISTVASLFGAELGAINEIMYGFSTAIFALTGITQLLTLAKGEEIAAIRASIAARYSEIFGGGFVAGLKNIGGKFLGFLSLALQALSRFIAPLAIATAALLSFKLIDDARRQEKERIEGMGNAAFAAGKKLEQIGNILNVQFRNIDRSAQLEMPAGLSEGGQERAASVRESDAFKTAIETSGQDGGFKEDLSALKNATLSEAEFALNNLALQLMALAPDGTDPESIREFVAALAAEAGKTDVVIDVNLDLKNKETFTKIQEDAKSSMDLVQASFSSTLESLNSGPSGTWLQGLLGDQLIIQVANKDLATSLNNLSAQYSSFFEATQTGFLNGTLSAAEYQTQITNMISQIASLGNAGTLVIENMFADFGVDEELAGVQDVANQLVLLEALMSGVDFKEAGIDIEAIDKMDNFGASTDDVAKGTAELEKLQKATSGAVAKTAEQMEKAKFDVRATEIKASSDALDAEIQANEDLVSLYPDLLTALGSEEEAIRAANDERIRTMLLKAKEQDLISGGTANYDAAIASLNELADSEKRANDVRAQAELGTYLSNLREQNNVLAWLTQNGMPVARALQVIANKTLLAGAAAALTADDYKNFEKTLSDIENLEIKLSPTSGGSREKTPLEQAIENLKNQKKEIQDTNIAYSKLIGAGFSAQQAFELAKDPMLAAAVAATGVKTAGWARLVALLKETNKQLEKQAIRDLIRGKAFEVANLDKQKDVSAALENLGYSYEQIQDIISDETALNMLSEDLKDGKLNAKDTLSYLINIKKIAKGQIALNFTTKEGTEKEFAKLYDKAVGYLQEQKTSIEIDFKLKSAADQAIVNEAQDKIDGLNYKIDDYEAELTEIESQEEVINKAYDKRIESLDKVSSLNDKIASKQKAQLTVADALADGDIAAAARAMQELNTQRAQEAIEDRKEALEKSRENSLGRLTSKNGNTRAQIEKEIKDLKQQIFDIEEDTLEPANERIRLLEIEKRDALDSLDSQILKWDELQNKVNLAKLKLTTEEMDAMKHQADLIADMLDNWDKIEDKEAILKILKKTYNITEGDEPNNTTTTTKKGGGTTTTKKKDGTTTTTTKQPVVGGGGGGGPKMFLASGGKVTGPGTSVSDSIPAMLSNGEYVVKASSVKKFGPELLEFINEYGSLPGYRTGGLVIPDRITSKPAATKPATSSVNVTSKLAAVKKAESRIVGKAPVSEKSKRDKLYKGGGFQGFEAGFQGMMADIGKNPAVQALGKAYSADNLGGKAFRAVTAVLSTPVEIVGAVAKNAIDMYGMGAKGDISGLLKAGITGLPSAFVKGTVNAFSGVNKAANQKSSMFEQAAQSAINNNIFGGKNNPELAALARIIGGSLNVFGDPLTYLGVGAATKGVAAAKQAAAAAASSVARPRSIISTKQIEIPNTRQVIEGFDGTQTYANFIDTIQTKNKKPIAFQGFTSGIGRQNLSELSSELDVIFPTPINLLKAAKTRLPSFRNIKLQSMIKKFEDKKIGKSETKLLDNMNASVFMDDLGNVDKVNILGLQQVLSSLSGNRASRKLLNDKRSLFLQMIETNRLKKVSERAEHRSSFPIEEPAADPTKVSAIHSTGHKIERDSRGNIILRPHGEYTDPTAKVAAARSSLHFTLEAPVKDHFQGTWDPYQSKIVSRLSSIVENNGMPYALNPVDTFWNRSPGQPLRIPNASVITPYKNMGEYSSELKRRGLLKSGETPANIVSDDARKEVLYYLPESIASAKGDDLLKIQQEALDAAKKQVGTSITRRYLQDHGTNDGFFDNSIRKLAVDYGSTIDKHGETFPAQAEGLSGNSWSGVLGSAKAADSIEAMRAIALQGRFPMREIFQEVSAKYMGGGYVRPKYFSTGGEARGTDTIPAMLTPGEFVMRKAAVDRIGVSNLQSMNNGSFSMAQPSYTMSSINMPSMSEQKFNISSSSSNVMVPVSNSSMSQESVTKNLSSVYNYNLSVNVKSDANPDQIAKTVMNQIRQIDSQRIRSNRF